MRLGLGASWLAIAAVASIACAGKLATSGEGADGGEGADAAPVGSPGFSSSSGSSSGIGSTGSSGGVSSGSSGSPGSDDGGMPTDDAGPPGPDCGAIPTVHLLPAGDIYCGFGTDGGPLTCTASAGAGFCCLAGPVSSTMYGPQICAQNAAGCMIPSEGMGPIPIQCNQISDCPANGAPGATACCLQGGSAPTPVTGCGYFRVKAGSAVVCEGSSGGAATSCAAGETQICSSNADCPSGTTCHPSKWKIFQLGFCL